MVIAVLLGILAATPGSTANPATAFQLQGGVDLSGQWSSNWGPVLLQHNQTGVSGTWLQPAGMGACPATSPGCLGQFTGGAFDVGTGVLTVAYYQSWNDTTGSATFQLSADGTTLTGSWTQPDASDNWVLRRQ
jgi:hypothetical protein